jgi:hypothetical protein
LKQIRKELEKGFVCISIFCTFAVAIKMQTATAGCGSAKAKRACLRVHLAPQLQRQ